VGLSLSGWFLGVDWLTSLGFGLRIWPWTAIGLLCLAGAFLLLLRGRPTGARILLLGLLSIGLLSWFQSFSGIDLGLDRVFFPAELGESRTGRPPGRPPPHLIAAMLLLAAALMLSAGRSQRGCHAACLLSSIPLALATISAGLLLMRADLRGDAAYYLASSLPSSLATILIALGICFRCQGVGWTGSAHSTPWTRTLASVLPLVLLIPAMTALLEMQLEAQGVGSHFLIEAATAVVTVLLFTGLLVWALGRLAIQRAAVHKLTQALDSAPIALVRPDGTIRHWSQGCERLYGWTAEQARDARRHVLLESRPDESEAALLALGQGQALDRELVDTTREGRQIRVLEHAHRIDTGGDEPTIVLSMTDISVRSEIEAALELNRQRLADAVEAFGLGTFEWDPITGKLSWAAGSEARIGLEPGLIHDFDSFREHVDEEDFARLLSGLEAATEARLDRFDFRFHYRSPTGEDRDIEGTARLYYDAAGELLRLVGINADVTEREAHAARLEAQAAQLQSMLDTVPDAMIVIDAQGKIRHFGAGAARTLGYSAAEMEGKSYLVLAPDRLRSNYAAALDLYLETGKPRLIGRVTRSYARRADGSEIPVEVLVGEATSGASRLFTLLLRDISERLAAEDRLSALSAELAHVSRLSAMGEMAAGIAHELNQPLTAVSNYLAAAGVLIRSGRADPEKMRELVEIAGSQTIRAGQIIRRMRNFAAKGQVDVQAEPVHDTLREAADLVFVGPVPLQISLRYELDAAAATMLVDRIQLQQVLVNLLRNALQAIQSFADARKEIVVSTSAAGNGMIEIGVSDTGPGLSEAALARLFEPFTSSGDKGGMGVGLSICRRIVEAHGGRIWAVNRPEGGASFRFTVPGLSDNELEEM
jgi:two-component system, LuxR family, sensor kinase FixL